MKTLFEHLIKQHIQNTNNTKTFQLYERINGMFHYTYAAITTVDDFDLLLGEKTIYHRFRSPNKNAHIKERLADGDTILIRPDKISANIISFEWNVLQAHPDRYKKLDETICADEFTPEYWEEHF